MSDLETINANLRREIEEARANANGLRAVISGVSDERDNALKELAIHDAEDVDVERGFNAAKAIIARLSAVIEEARARLERDIQDTTAELVILEGHPNATDGQIGRCAAKRSEAKDLLAILAKAEEPEASYIDPDTNERVVIDLNDRSGIVTKEELRELLELPPEAEEGRAPDNV